MKTKASIEIVTPTFIWGGEEYSPTDYYVDKEKNKLYFIDRKKFTEEIIKKNLFDKFINVSGNIEKLKEFIKNNFQENMVIDEIDIDSVLSKELEKTLSRPIKTFIKDKFLFRPYIPGSTIKGIIRTAILDYKIKQFENDEAVNKVIQEIKKLKKELKEKKCNEKEFKKYKKNLFSLLNQFETIIFCNENRKNGRLQFDATKDILKTLFVSDFKPIKYKLRITKPKNRPFKNKTDNPIPTILELLIDGKFNGEIRIDENLLKRDRFSKNNKYFQDEQLSIELIKKALDQFYKKIYEIEDDKFNVKLPPYQSHFIKIGEYSGAGSKSLNDLRVVYISQIRKCLDYQLSVWIYNNEPLGWAKMEILK